MVPKKISRAPNAGVVSPFLVVSIVGVHVGEEWSWNYWVTAPRIHACDPEESLTPPILTGRLYSIAGATLRSVLPL